MIPVPNYLRDNVEVIKQKNENLTIKLKCTCGGYRFAVFKNVAKKPKISSVDRKKIRDSIKWYEEMIYPMVTNSCYKAGYINYETYHEIFLYDSSNLSGNRFDKEKDRSSIIKAFHIENGDVPLTFKEISTLEPMDDTIIIKTICSNCSKEYVVFDNRIHGNDTADFKPVKLEDYDFRQKLLKRSTDNTAEIIITIKNFWNFDNLHKADNLNLTLEDYSNMYSYIKIQASNNGTNELIFSEELG